MARRSPKWWGEEERRRQQNRQDAAKENARRAAELRKRGGVQYTPDIERTRALLWEVYGDGEGIMDTDSQLGRNPYGECESGHRSFRGGCQDCVADMSGR